MVVQIAHHLCDGYMLKWVFAAGVSWLAHHRERVNNMNVFPVPDGDTGTNMLLTIQKAYSQVQYLEEAHVGLMSRALADGALMGARGNSGTILSMLLRGFALGLERRDIMDAASFADACQKAVEYAYERVGSVMKPVEGTILTVAREAAAAVQENAPYETSLRVLLTEMIAAAYQSLERTPELLPVLKQAGVVDSGGMGLVMILEGMKRLLDGEPVSYDGYENNGVVAPIAADWKEALEPEDEEGYGYDVQFLMIGENLNLHRISRDISSMGWSPLIEGDERLIKVHIHVHNPGEPISYAIGLGVQLDDIVVENMQAQYLRYVQTRETREDRAKRQVDGVAVITVARGAGIKRVMEEYGAAVIIEGGQTMNPGTEDFLNAIESLDTDEIILLPNNGNVIMAAEQAAALAHGRRVRVVHNKTIPQGIAALIAYGDAQQHHASLDKIHDAMLEATHSVISCEITTATRTVTIDDIEVVEGSLIGLLNGKLAVTGRDITEVMRGLLHRAHAEDHEIATLYYGTGVNSAAASALAATLAEEFEHLEFEVVAGEQPLYPYMISIE
jgi:hypothetical protein